MGTKKVGRTMAAHSTCVMVAYVFGKSAMPGKKK
jgi:hypothetical protein